MYISISFYEVLLAAAPLPLCCSKTFVLNETSRFRNCREWYFQDIQYKYMRLGKKVMIFPTSKVISPKEYL